ncbi:RPM1-interacting protein 4-like [Durio zibethinus]|uniref:RPM1-interacting protein 4-like n=1 Tax=Durio zibethinus TaxID=66656 RepID=A0A6P5XYV5_DURZI|nr:RPM1-interacting protein 4-like [Durio zibethinus]
MSSYQKRQPLPKFGEWDVKDPASAEGFTAIFNKARDEKRTGENVSVVTTEAAKPQQKHAAYKERNKHKFSIKRKWFCCA